MHSVSVAMSILRTAAVRCRSSQVVGRRLTLSGSVAPSSLVFGRVTMADYNHSAVLWDNRSNLMVISLCRRGRCAPYERR